MRKAFLVFSRIDSSRLPAKALLNLDQSTVLGSILKTLQRFENIDPIVLTSDRKVDDCIEAYADSLGLSTFRGSLENVSARIVGAIEYYDLDAFFRVNGDSPCLDLDLLRQAELLFEEHRCDFVSNLVHRTYPYGVAAELFDAQKYVETQKRFASSEHREHATTYFYQHLEDFNYQQITNNEDWSDLSLTIDTLEDYLRLRSILDRTPEFLDLDLEQKVNLIKERSYD